MEVNTHSNLIEKTKKWFKQHFTREKVKGYFLGTSTGRRMFRLYFLVLFISALILYLPISLQPFIDNGYKFGENIWYQNNAYWIKLEDGSIAKFDFLDCLFMSFSTFTDTGLSLFPINQVFSIFGKVIMMIEIQIGGFGIMFFIFIFWKLIKKTDKVTVNQQLLAQSEKGNTKLGTTSRMLITSSIVIIVIEIIFAFFYSLWFLYVPSFKQVIFQSFGTFENGLKIGPDVYVDDPNGTFSIVYNNPANAFFCGFFHSISVVNNAGFDILGPSSLSGFRNGVHTIFLFATAIQFIIGGIGFPIIFDIFSTWRLKKVKKCKVIENRNICYWKIIIIKDREHKLSLFTKLTLVSYFGVLILGIIFSFIFEATTVGGGIGVVWNNEVMFGDNSDPLTWYNKSINVIFQSISTRSAGYSTFNNALLNPITKWLNIVLMFIGGSASSTAGGIRVTTLAIIFITISARIKGSVRASAFKRNIENQDIVNSYIVFTVSLILISIGGIIILSDTRNSFEYDKYTNHYFTDSIFLCTSAFGTTGLSTFDISTLNWYSKIYLMFLMFVGQYGVSSTILAFRRSKVKENMYKYVSESVRIG